MTWEFVYDNSFCQCFFERLLPAFVAAQRVKTRNFSVNIVACASCTSYRPERVETFCSISVRFVQCNIFALYSVHQAHFVLCGLIISMLSVSLCFCAKLGIISSNFRDVLELYNAFKNHIPKNAQVFVRLYEIDI